MDLTHTYLPVNTDHTSTQHQHHRRKRSVAATADDLAYVHFQLSETDLPADIDESNVRLMVKSHAAATAAAAATDTTTRLRIYQLIEPYGRLLLDTATVRTAIVHAAGAHWIQFDVRPAIENWLAGDPNFGFEIVCVGCVGQGLHIVHELSAHNDGPELLPRLNVVGKMVAHREKRSRQHRHFMQSPYDDASGGGGGGAGKARRTRKTDCNKENQKCCRHTMDVVFKEIKGFEFIIQPKNFDAGYCRGKCPPRYNPAHHHAVLQSLIWKQDRQRAPRPCCAPSKLVELEVLHVDEEDPSKLKVSKWSDMRVLECACS